MGATDPAKAGPRHHPQSSALSIGENSVARLGCAGYRSPGSTQFFCRNEIVARVRIRAARARANRWASLAGGCGSIQDDAVRCLPNRRARTRTALKLASSLSCAAARTAGSTCRLCCPNFLSPQFLLGRRRRIYRGSISAVRRHVGFVIAMACRVLPVRQAAPGMIIWRRRGRRRCSFVQHHGSVLSVCRIFCG